MKEKKCFHCVLNTTQTQNNDTINLSMNYQDAMPTAKPMTNKTFQLDGNAFCFVFFNLTSGRRALVATLGDKVHDFVAKIQLIEILAIFFCNFLSFRDGYTCNFRRTLATRQFSKTRITNRKQNIAPAAAALCKDRKMPHAFHLWKSIVHLVKSFFTTNQ